MADLSGEMEVWQSNRLVEAGQHLTLAEKRLIMAAAALHDPRRPPPHRGTVVVRAAEFAEVFDIDTKHVYEALADAAKRLYNRSIRSIRTSKGKVIERDVRWVWMAEYHAGEGTVTLGFSPVILPYLTVLRTEFTRYKLKYVGNISSYYGIRLYEILAQYRKAGKRTLTLEQLREILSLGDKYPSVRDLRRRVLDPGLTDINRYTDLQVTMTPTTRGRTITGFHFHIGTNEQIALDLPPPDAADAAPGAFTATE